MKPLASLTAGMAMAAATLSMAATAHAGGPPNDGGGGGGAPAPAATPGSCSGAGLSVTSGPVEPANTLRHVVVTFTNTSSAQCTLVGYPDANLVTAAGGVLVHVDREPALASHLLHLNPGDSATATVVANDQCRARPPGAPQREFPQSVSIRPWIRVHMTSRPRRGRHRRRARRSRPTTLTCHSCSRRPRSCCSHE